MNFDLVTMRGPLREPCSFVSQLRPLAFEGAVTTPGPELLSNSDLLQAPVQLSA